MNKEKGDKELRHSVKTVIIALILFAVIIPALGCPAPTTTMANTIVKLVPSKKKVQPGEAFSVDVVVEPAADVNVAGVQFDLEFNEQSLNINSVQEGPFLSQGGANSFFGSGEIDNEAGQLANVYGVILGAGQSVDQPGVFATIQCTAVNPSTTSAFALSDVIVGNKDGVALPLELITEDQVVVVLFGDVNLDGVVDMADIEAIAAVFGDTGAPGWTPADVAEDGAINVLDLILVGQKLA